MKTIASPDVLQSIAARLQALTPASARRWGSLTPHEMLCHLGDACEMVLRIRPRARPVAPRGGAFILKALWLWSPLRPPHGVRTNPSHDPRTDGTRPSEFEKDRARVLSALLGIAAADDGLEPEHGLFGSMSARDWHRWAWKHTDHHLRQFGL